MVPSTRDSPSDLRERVRKYARDGVRIDARTLAFFRVVVGLLILADLVLRSRNFHFFYTDEGVVPRELATQYLPDGAFSFYHLTGDPAAVAVLFVLQGVIAVQLIVGYKTRIATVLSFLFVISLDHRNPLVLSYADTLFRLLLFWAIFLPLEERWSVDAVHRDREPRESIASVASALILFQMVFMYVVNGIHKTHSETWTSGEAAPLVLGMNEITFLLGGFVSGFPTLLGYGGLLWFYMLLSSPLLLLLRGRPRTLLVALFVGGHASFALTVRIGAFAYVAMAGVSLFLGARFWDDLRALASAAGVDVPRLVASLARLEAIADCFPRYRLEGDRQRRFRAGAYNATLAVIVASIGLVVVVVIAQAGVPLGDDVYESEERQAEFELVLEENAGARQINDVATRLGIDQPPWSVFAPEPRTTDRYYVFPAETERGERIDAYNDRPLTYERPGDQLQKQYGTYRERFYMNSVRNGGPNGDTSRVLAEHLCATWEGEDGDRLTHVNMYYVGENVTMETIDTPEDREIAELLEIYRHGCGDNEPKEIDPPDRDRINGGR